MCFYLKFTDSLILIAISRNIRGHAGPHVQSQCQEYLSLSQDYCSLLSGPGWGCFCEYLKYELYSPSAEVRLVLRYERGCEGGMSVPIFSLLRVEIVLR